MVFIDQTSDGDSIYDSEDPDDDNDGVSDLNEFLSTTRLNQSIVMKG
jgi:hypothetical protein